MANQVQLLLVVLVVVVFAALAGAGFRDGLTPTPRLAGSAGSTCDGGKVFPYTAPSGSATDSRFYPNTLSQDEIKDILQVTGNDIPEYVKANAGKINGGNEPTFKGEIDENAADSDVWKEPDDSKKSDVQTKAEKNCVDKLSTALKAALTACEGYKTACPKGLCAASGPTDAPTACAGAECTYSYQVTFTGDAEKDATNPLMYKGTYEYKCTSYSGTGAKSCSCDVVKVSTPGREEPVVKPPSQPSPAPESGTGAR